VLAESIIGDSGYRTLSAASGREALALLEQGAAVALLFTDINLGAEPDASNWLGARSRPTRVCR
jgi:CheY-like chemotaxis protein